MGARLSSTGCSAITSSSTAHTSLVSSSTRDLAFLMLNTTSFSTSFFMMKGLNSSRAILVGSPHWCSLRSGPTTITERPE